MSWPHWVCPYSWRVCFPGLHCSGFQVALQGNCPKQALCFVNSPGLNCSGLVLGYSTKAQTQLGLCFVPFPGLSSSANQMVGQHTLPGVQCILSPTRSWLLSFLGVQ